MFKRENGISQIALTMTIFILLILVIFVFIVISRKNNKVFYEDTNVSENNTTNEEIYDNNKITEYPLNDENVQDLIS